MALSILQRFPREILDQVALELVASNPLRGHADYLALSSTCKHLHELLGLNSSASVTIQSEIFKSVFDIGAARRRFGRRAVRSPSLATQLRKQWDTLQFLRRGNIHAPDLEHHLWTAFLMMVDSDGRNQIQLECAALGVFVERLVRTRLWEGRELNSGWPLETTVNTLALWLLWLTTTSERLSAESRPSRLHMINLVMPFVHLSVRYPSFQAPDVHFSFPLPEELEGEYPYAVVTPHGPWPVYREPSSIKHRVVHYGQELEISRPLIAQAARLIYFSRREVEPIGIPTDIPINRMHAIQIGQPRGPTQADVVEFNAHRQAKPLPRPKWYWRNEWAVEELALERGDLAYSKLKAPSSRWDNNFERWAHCWNIWKEPDPVKGLVYTPGSLSGLWHGRMLVPNDTAYMNLVGTPQMPDSFLHGDPFINGRPLYMRLNEHHCVSPEVPVSIGGRICYLDDGVQNAWLPPIRSTRESGNAVLLEEADGHKTKYETYIPGRPNSHDPNTCEICLAKAESQDDISSDSSGSPSPQPYDISQSVLEDAFAQAGLGEADDIIDDTRTFLCNGIRDIYFSGRTDPRHSEAWNSYRYFGRCRPWDGLIAIVRIYLNPVTGLPDHREGHITFRGYLIGDQNFVGTWRTWTPHPNAFPLEGPFVMSKRDD